jgi:hypothetical protein
VYYDKTTDRPTNDQPAFRVATQPDFSRIKSTTNKFLSILLHPVPIAQLEQVKREFKQHQGLIDPQALDDIHKKTN